MNYGRAFRVLRGVLGLKTAHLADRAGYAHSMVAHVESLTPYRRDPSKASLANITQALGATPRLMELLAVEDPATVDPAELGRELLAFIAKEKPLPSRIGWRKRLGRRASSAA